MLSLFFACYLTFCCFALAMFGNFRDVFARPIKPLWSNGLRLLAWGSLCLGYAVCINTQGVAYGSVIYMGLCTLAALLVVLSLNYKPKQLPSLMLLSLVFVSLDALKAM
ncbi:conserved hypothetical protein [Shewanella denitrificans OS217]|uniref:DUF3325 domain-containing protein n=1 Tax=Shewanella denitrificans (strain OS217 / ATCC BAA-1090 / DSM 15013) TaxID=318161 RepID=Q12LN9_SHEDO|nr:DUF3325 domain-containing protein [Shewanella denitrificans]ABE55637.1 conserved hypothetical protein [Shewanella denitrificans OS217]